jgi:hypothetical protein
MICIGTAFYLASGHAPNLRKSSEKNKLSIYYRCMVVFFASARRQYPSAELVLFTNAQPIDEYLAILQRFNVLIEILPINKITYVSGELSNSFPGCLFTLDVIDFCSSEEWLAKHESLTLFDSDCIIRKPFQLPKEQIAGIKIEYPIDHCVNGQSRGMLSKISNIIFGITGEIDYYGGEYYHIPASKLEGVSEYISEVYSFICNNEEYGDIFTEEHIMSLVYAKYSEVLESSSSVIKRIWTANTFNNIENTDNNISVFHLPAEKERLFTRYFESIMSDNDYFHNHDYFSDTFNYCTKRANPSFPIKVVNNIKRMVKTVQRIFKNV